MMSVRIRASIGLTWCLTVAVLLIVTNAAGAPAPARPGAPPAPSQDAVLRIGTFGGIPAHMSPFDYQGRLQADIENIYEPLVYPYQGTWDIKGVLAENWTASADGTVYRFNLRRGVVFHDGTPFNANAVKVSFDYFRKTAKSAGEPILRNVRDVRVIDDNTIEFVIEPSGVPFLVRMTGFLVASPRAVEANGGNPDWFARNAVGSGPYMLDEFRTGDRLILRRNDRWWGTRPYFARVIYLTVPEPSAQALMIEQGELDIAYNIPPESLRTFERRRELKVTRVKGDRVMNVRLNVSHGALTNLALRQALAYAVDYDAMAKARELEVSPPDGPVPAQYMQGWTPRNLIVKQNLVRAKELLEKAGHKPGSLKLDMYIPVGASVQITAGEILQASLAKIGVTLNVTQTEWTPMFNRLQRFAKDKNPADAVDIFTMIRGPFVPHQYAYFNSYERGQPNNFMVYENKAVQDLLERGYSLPKAADAIGVYRQGTTRIVADQPDLWMYVEKRVVVQRSNIDGFYMHPTWFPETHAWTIYKR